MGNLLYKNNVNNYNDINYLHEKINIKNEQINQYYELLKKKSESNMKLLKYYFLIKSNQFQETDNLNSIKFKIREQNYKIKKIKDILEYEINIMNDLINYKNKIII